MPRPRIGITPDVVEIDGRTRIRLATAYADRVERAGGLPIILHPQPSLADSYLALCAGFILSGGDDPIMEEYGRPTHPMAVRVRPERQAFELALLRAIARQHHPALGICLGMQYMALEAGGDLDQHLPEVGSARAEAHMGRAHPIAARSPLLTDGLVISSHHQAVRHAGSLRVVAEAPDGVVEAIADATRPFYLGVQWHPERTDDQRLGQGLFDRLVEAADASER